MPTSQPQLPERKVSRTRHESQRQRLPVHFRSKAIASALQTCTRHASGGWPMDAPLDAHCVLWFRPMHADAAAARVGTLGPERALMPGSPIKTRQTGALTRARLRPRLRRVARATRGSGTANATGRATFPPATTMAATAPRAPASRAAGTVSWVAVWWPSLQRLLIATGAFQPTHAITPDVRYYPMAVLASTSCTRARAATLQRYRRPWKTRGIPWKTLWVPCATTVVIRARVRSSW